MPKIKSAKKALRQNISRRKANIKKTSEFKKLIKEYKKTVAAKNMEKAVEELPQIYKKLDKAAKTKLIKKNKASRLKSGLSKLLKQKNP